MPTVTVRVRPQTYRVLRDMARKHNESLLDTLDRVVEEAWRTQMFKEASEAYVTFAADPGAYAEWRTELAAWDVTVGDGLQLEPFDET